MQGFDHYDYYIYCRCHCRIYIYRVAIDEGPPHSADDLADYDYVYGCFKEIIKIIEERDAGDAYIGIDDRRGRSGRKQ